MQKVDYEVFDPKKGFGADAETIKEALRTVSKQLESETNIPLSKIYSMINEEISKNTNNKVSKGE